MHANGTAWIGDGIDDYWAENAATRVEVQRTDENEVRIGVMLLAHGVDSDDATIYLTVAEASRLAHLIGTAVLANEAAAHEAAQLGGNHDG